MSNLTPGKPCPIRLSVRRVVAPNASFMTGPGTNTYLIGNHQLAVIDPGPANPEHTETLIRITQTLGATIRWILCTHTHPDHSPGAALLKHRTGARLLGALAPAGPSQDHEFAPDEVWAEGSRLDTDEFSLVAVHTPGHASNHLCFYQPEEKLLYTGDHIMQGSTVVIAPPDGNMSHYLQSLEKLKPMDIAALAPGHGEIIQNPLEVIEGLIEHRLMRENKTLARLQSLGPSTLETLTPAVYDEVPAWLHGLARLSLTAHLYKLRDEGRALYQNEVWSLP
ncbi:Predicted beta-lactamase family protein [gamma proteobacterium HdN1]|nr:Predicted beta-lactamase family protein [gamma proteobacterium HdN1]